MKLLVWLVLLVGLGVYDYKENDQKYYNKAKCVLVENTDWFSMQDSVVCATKKAVDKLSK